MNTQLIESLLKQKLLESVSSSDWDMVRFYSDQLTLLSDLDEKPIEESMQSLCEMHSSWLEGQVPDEEFLSKLEEFYGKDLYNICVDFFHRFGGADFCDITYPE